MVRVVHKDQSFLKTTQKVLVNMGGLLRCTVGPLLSQNGQEFKQPAGFGPLPNTTPAIASLKDT